MAPLYFIPHSALRTPQSPKAVLFDAAGTLFRVRGSVGAIYLAHARRFGFDSERAGEEDLTAAFACAFRAQPPLAFGPQSPETATALEVGWWRDLVQRVFEPYGPFPNFDQFFESLFQNFATPEHWALEPGCVQLLGLLKERGARLGVVSNFDSRLASVLESLDVARFFEAIVISSRCQAAKPDPSIFRTACSRLECPPAEAMHVGDSPVEDVKGARSAGLRAVLYDPGGRYPEFEGERVARLVDLLKLTG